MRILSTFLAAALLATQAPGREIYVNNVAGNDVFNGLEPRNEGGTAGPVRTLAKALRLSERSDHIILENTGQPYRESVSLVGSRHSGLPKEPLVIEGHGAVLDGTAPVPTGHWKFYRDNIFSFRPPRMGPQQLFLNGRPAARLLASDKAEVLPDMDPGQWCSHRGYFYFAVGGGKLPDDCNLTYASLPTGITLYQVEHVRIENLKVQGFQLDGIHLHAGRHVVLHKVTVQGNGNSGITVGGASQLELDSSTVDRNGVAQLITMPYSETHVYNSSLPNGTGPGWLDRNGRVYLGTRRVSGGMESIKPEDSRKPALEAGPEAPKPAGDGAAARDPSQPASTPAPAPSPGAEKGTSP